MFDRIRRLWTWVRATLACLAVGQKGQGMTEYASITTLLVFGTIAATGGFPFFKMLIEAFDRYLSSVYFTLNLALP